MLRTATVRVGTFLSPCALFTAPTPQDEIFDRLSFNNVKFFFSQISARFLGPPSVKQ